MPPLAATSYHQDDVERRLLAQLDREYSVAEAALVGYGALSAEPSWPLAPTDPSQTATKPRNNANASWKSNPEQRRRRKLAPQQRRNSFGSTNGNATDVASSCLSEGDWRNFLSGLNGAVQRAAETTKEERPQRQQQQSVSKLHPQQQQQRRSLRRSRSLGRAARPTDASQTTLRRHRPRPQPRSALRRGRFAPSAASDNRPRLFVDEFLARSSRSLPASASSSSNELKFHTPTVYHISQEGQLRRTENSWTSSTATFTSPSLLSVMSQPRERTSALTYSKQRRMELSLQRKQEERMRHMQMQQLLRTA